MIRTSFPPIIMTERSYGMAITDGTVFQEAMLHVDFVQFSSDVSTANSRLEELQAAVMDNVVDLPNTQMCVRYMVKEEGTFHG